MDLIHAAAIDPSAWDAVLRRLATLTGCVAGGLTSESPATRRGIPLTYFGFDPDHVESAFDHYLPLNPLFGIERRMQPGFVVTNSDVVPLAEFQQSEFYNGWSRPQQLCSPVTVVIHRTQAAYIPLTLVRADGTGDVSGREKTILSRLAPHLSHAMNVTINLQRLSDTQGLKTAILEAMPSGALLIDGKRRVTFANDPARAELKRAHGIFISRTGELAAVHPATDRRLQAALSAALGDGTPPKGGRVSLERSPGKPRMTLDLSPLPRSENWWSALRDDFGTEAGCLVLVTAADVSSIADDYGLTPGETRVLGAVLAGEGLASAGRTLGIARSTVHTHLRNIFQKTGTHRQAELVALAMGRPGC